MSVTPKNALEPTGLPTFIDGYEFLRNRFFNKDTAFTQEERERLQITGMLPPCIETLEQQVSRMWNQLVQIEKPIHRYQLLRSVQDSNNVLFYALIATHLVDILPIIYTPTVGEACQKFGALYQRHHGVYFSKENKGQMRQLLQNVRRAAIDIIVITDGSRILGLGDLGTNGMGIPIGKCSLYVAGAGIHPRRVLPVTFDSGTNNEVLRQEPTYQGHRRTRDSDEDFYAMLDEFMQAVKEEWPTSVTQFEDFSNNHCFDVLERYREKYRCFNDDIQGTGAVIAAGFQNAVKLSKVPARDHRVLVYGAGSAAVGVALSIAELISTKHGIDKAEFVKSCIYLVDTKGLVTTTRGDHLASHKVALARTDVPAEQNASLRDLMDIVRFVRPTTLIGLSAAGPTFTQEILEFMCTYTERPIVFPLSNPTSKSEINPDDAYRWSKGRAICASGSPYPATVLDGKTYKPSQGNNLYVFPGVGLGSALAQPRTITETVLASAASCLADLVSDDVLFSTDALYPPLTEIRRVSVELAVSVCQQTQKEGLGGAHLPKDVDELRAVVRASMWDPVYYPTEVYRVTPTRLT